MSTFKSFNLEWPNHSVQLLFDAVEERVRHKEIKQNLTWDRKRIGGFTFSQNRVRRKRGEDALSSI